MKVLYTIDELLAMRTNGWGCECGAAWLDVAPGISHKVADGDPDHRHRSLRRARFAIQTRNEAAPSGPVAAPNPT